MKETINDFIAARLLTANTIGDIPTIEISHEALIREWSRLLEWIRTDRSDILLQRAISEDAGSWIRSGKSEDRLYRGTQLIEAQAWAERNKPSADEIAFLEASVAERERRAREEREQIERELDLQRRATRRQRYVIGMIGVTSIVLVLGLIVSLVLQNNLLVTQRNLVKTQNNLLASLPVAVTNMYDKGPGSLREAIATAAPGSTITFAKYLKGTIALTSGELTIDKNLTISGPGASLLTVSGDNKSRVFHVLDNVVATISNLTVKDGKAPYGAGIDNIGTLFLSNIVISSNIAIKDSSNPTPNGGGIGNAGTLFVAKSMISANEADYGGGVVNLGTLYFTDGMVFSNTAHIQGGGIYNLGNMAIHNSTISDNASNAAGGGVYNGSGGTTSDDGIFTISNSTISDNKANTDGGGIYNDGASPPYKTGTLTLTNSTISGNISNANGGGIDSLGNTSITYGTIYGNTAKFGGGIATMDNGTLTVKTSIIASDKASIGPDVLGPITLLYPNLIQNISSAKITFGSDPSDPTINTYSRKSIFDQSPNLGPLQDNGGPTQTLALLPGSPAIGQIPQFSGSSFCGFNGLTIFVDQRNSSRPRVRQQGQSCDLGAYESS